MFQLTVATGLVAALRAAARADRQLTQGSPPASRLTR